VTSSNATLLPASDISGATNCTEAGLCKLRLRATTAKGGSATVTVTVSDASGETATGSFTVKVSKLSGSTGGGSFSLWTLLEMVILGIGSVLIQRDRMLNHLSDLP